MSGENKMECPVCDQSNTCAQVCGSGRGPCWCFDVATTKPLIQCLADSGLSYACLCKRCLVALVDEAKVVEPAVALEKVRARFAPALV